MYRIYYFSTATDNVTEQDHENILEVARRNNKALGITGLLVVKGRFFIQVLEGDEQAVMSLYKKIKQDKRHRRVVEIWKGSVDDRIFGAWRMGFRDIGLSDEFSEVDLDDPTFVSNPAELERVFRRLIEMSPTAI